MSEKDSERKESFLSSNLIHILFVVLVIAVIFLFFTFFTYAQHFSPPPSQTPEIWGAYGDYIGGLLNPVFSFLAFFALLLTIIMQRDELKLSRDELTLTREELELSTKELANSANALKDQSESLKLQNFENTFFQMLKIHGEIIQDMYSGDPDSGNIGIRGRGCFKVLYEEFKRTFVINKGRANEDPSLINRAYTSFHTRYHANLGHYFRNMYTIIKFVENAVIFENQDDKKKSYVNILRAQLSTYELSLLFYNCLWHVGRGKFKPLVEKYKLFDNMALSEIVDEYAHILQYDRTAYGSQDVEKYYKD